MAHEDAKVFICERCREPMTSEDAEWAPWLRQILCRECKAAALEQSAEEARG